MSGGKRPGRPWSPPKGPCQEINDIVAIIRDWLDGAGITVRGLHAALTQDHFADENVPDERKLRERLAGVGLTWDTVEAVADICFADESQATTGQHLEKPRALWKAAEEQPTVVGVDGEPAVPARELLQAQERAISALEELNRARKAYEASERARHQSLQMATVLFALLGQAQAQVRELSRRLESLQASPDALSREIDVTHLRLRRVATQEDDLRIQLARAEAERERAQALADLAARRIEYLESELRGVGSVDPVGAGSGSSAVVLAEQVLFEADADSRLDQVDATLRKAREVLDREHEAVQEIADELGAEYPPGVGDGAVRGRIVRVSGAEDVPAPSEDGLFGTTPHNRQPGTALVVRQGDRMRFVGAAARRISRGLDLDEIVMGLCRATVPTFADSIFVYLRDPLPVGDDRPVGPVQLRLRRTDRLPDESTGFDSFLPVDPRTAEVDEGPVMPPEMVAVRPGSTLAEVLQGVRPVFGDPAHHDALHQLLGDDFNGPSGSRALLAPLRGLRRVVGAAVFLRRLERVPFEPDDLQVAGQLATQTALGIDKALLYDREAYLAAELQRSMLPQTLPRASGVRLAARYLPAAETARIGGDWYDAIPLPGSRVALVAGDVMGHSMTSAAVMGQLRTTTQTLAGLDLPPQEVLHHLDEQAQRLGTDRMATCLYAVYDPVSHRITIANAGHPPPVLLHPGGRAEVLHVPPGAPVGVGGVDFEAVELGVPAGSTLVLYTDGLVESRMRDISTGIEQLREQLAATALLTEPGAPPPLEYLCDEILNILGPGDRDDDIALLTARFDGLTASDVAHQSLGNTHEAPLAGSQFTRQTLDGWGLGHVSDIAERLVGELITSAVDATPIIGPIELRLMRTHVLRCEVQDRSTEVSP
ncbi:MULTISPECIES: SpoIIE family protein phosphatase [Streptomyces]|uniref:SpoIIE family protein phosphatase n=2 Tax=Streptomyces TaxID=1883 RepID=A0ABV9J7W6_9ACTN